MFNRFINYLLLNSSFTNEIGLFNGKAAMPLYCSSIGSFQKNEWVNHIGFSFLEETISQINRYTPLIFGDGIAGVGVLLEYLAQQGQLEQDPGDLLVESEPYLLSAIYGAKLQDIGIANGISGMGLYFLHRLQSSYPANPFQQLRFKESIIACIDQVYHIINRSDSNLQLPDITIWNGLSGVLLFLFKAHDLKIYEPFTEQLTCHIANVLYQQIKAPAFSWQQTHAWFALLHCNFPGHPISQNQLLLDFRSYIEHAKLWISKIDFYEASFTALLLRLIFHTTQLDNALTLSDQVKDHVLQLLNKKQLPDLFPFNKNDQSVPVGLRSGVCGTALPLLSLETGDYRWLSTLGINTK